MSERMHTHGVNARPPPTCPGLCNDTQRSDSCRRRSALQADVISGKYAGITLHNHLIKNEFMQRQTPGPAREAPARQLNSSKRSAGPARWQATLGSSAEFPGLYPDAGSTQRRSKCRCAVSRTAAQEPGLPVGSRSPPGWGRLLTRSQTSLNLGSLEGSQYLKELKFNLILLLTPFLV